jgi:arylsulfatase A-like enzyme
VVDVLQRQGLAKDTVVVFTGDNGGRYEREALKAGHRTNGQLLGQKTDRWQGSHRVPLIERWRLHIEPGTLRKEFYLQVDLMATQCLPLLEYFCWLGQNAMASQTTRISPGKLDRRIKLQSY